MYQLVITPSAKRSLKRLSHDAQETLLDAAQVLKENPFAGEKLTGSLSFLWSFHFKYQNAQYRIAYTVDQERHLVVIHLAGPRENFYDRLRRLF